MFLFAKNDNDVLDEINQINKLKSVIKIHPFSVQNHNSTLIGNGCNVHFSGQTIWGSYFCFGPRPHVGMAIVLQFFHDTCNQHLFIAQGKLV